MKISSISSQSRNFETGLEKDDKIRNRQFKLGLRMACSPIICCLIPKQLRQTKRQYLSVTVKRPTILLRTFYRLTIVTSVILQHLESKVQEITVYFTTSRNTTLH